MFPQDPFITDDHLLPYWEVSARLKIDEDFRNRAQDRSQVQQVVKGEIRQGNAEMISREVVSEVYGIEYFNGDDTVTAWWQSIREFNATATRMFTPYRTPGRQPQGTAKL